MLDRPRAAQLVKRVGRRFNVEMTRLDLTHAARRQTCMRGCGIDLVFDVGANRGQFVTWMRDGGYQGRIISFEPIPEVMDDMRRRLAGDPLWTGVECAVGGADGSADFNVSVDTVTSSLLAPHASLTDPISTAAVASSVRVEVRALESLWDEFVPAGSRVMLKIDVQGAEHAVLDGLGTKVQEVSLLEVEMGLVQLYSGGSTIHDLLPRLRHVGFDIVSLEPGFVNSASGQVLDVDVLLRR